MNDTITVHTLADAAKWFSEFPGQPVRLQLRPHTAMTVRSLEEAEHVFAQVEGPVGPANDIKIVLHCRRCIDECPIGESPESWARLSVGWTPRGIQVWCVRYDDNVIHIDFDGQQHSINTAPKDGTKNGHSDPRRN
jgi:hypothetical protein